MFPRLTHLRVLLASLLVTTALAAPSARRQVGALYGPDHVTEVTLSPDGEHLAYVKHSGPVAAVMVCALADPTHPETIFADVGERIGRFGASALSAAQVLYLGWAADHTLVYGISVPARNRSFRDAVHVVDVGTGKDRALIDSDAVEGSSFPSAAMARGDDTELPPAIPVSRHLRVVALDPTTTAAVIVEATGTRMVATDVYRVPLDGSRYRQTGSFDGEGRLWYDAQGRLRVHETPRINQPAPFAARGRRGPPAEPEVLRQRFEYRSTEAQARWHPLDALVKDGGFSHGDSDYFAPRSFPLGFGDDPKLLYFASNVGRDTYGVYALDLSSGQRTRFAVEDPLVDVADPGDPTPTGPLVFDRAHRVVGVRIPGWHPTTRWLDPALARLQQSAEQAFPGRAVRLLDWTTDLTRAVMLVSGPSDGGRLFLYEPGAAASLTELFRELPDVNANQLAVTEAFALPSTAGGPLTGFLTQARQPRLRPPPVVVICPDVPARTPDGSVFHREAQAYAGFGCLVLEVNYRGTDGFGRAHRDAIKTGYEQAPLADIRAALTWLAARQPFDHRRVALVGHGFGGFVALRAAQAASGEFRVVAAIAPPIEVSHWIKDEPPLGPSLAARVLPETLGVRRGFFTGNADRLGSLSLRTVPGALPGPALLIIDPRAGAVAAEDARHWRDALRQTGAEPELVEMPLALSQGEPGVAAVTRVAEFLNANLYRYRVDVGKEREVK